MLGFKKIVGSLLAAGTIAFGMLGVTSPAGAAQTVSGQITCVANPPQGAWLTANSGGSGWVTWSPKQGTTTMQYSKSLPNGGSWYLAVGCGGSTQSWGVVTYSNTYSGGGSFNFTCYDSRSAYGAYGRCQRT